MWFVRAPTFGTRERRHPHTRATWFRPMWMEETGAAPRKHPSGHCYGPQDAFWRAWLAATIACLPRRLVFFEGKCSAGWGGIARSMAVDDGGPGHRQRGGPCPLPAPRHVAGGGRRRGRGHAHRDRRVVGPPAHPHLGGGHACAAHACAARGVGLPTSRPPRLCGVRRGSPPRGRFRRGRPRPVIGLRRRSGPRSSRRFRRTAGAPSQGT